ncbi:AEC family transporter [Amphibiibacter pelophylacis]|uniref:AEC family transporter n=1 Tax=Amphibiibacter pelophylacis TaxID=1799477 RepID=A0ACC6NXV1_9BURK
MSPLLLLPDFLLIALGCALCRGTALNRPVWEGVERLVYFVLFPALLFRASATAQISASDALHLGGAGLGLSTLGVLAAYSLKRWPGVDATLHASGAQCAFRFNSYVALALADRISGTDGVAWTALLLALCVPFCNIAAVWPLARHSGQNFARELLRNPLIIGTLSGLLVNVLGWPLPGLADITLQRLGQAAVPLGLMAVGAGLRFGALREGWPLAAAFMGIRHLLLPLAAIAWGLIAGLPPGQQAMLVCFAALPTASSAFVLATRMGGNGPFVAGLITLSTLLALPGVPLALWALSHVSRLMGA